MLADAATRERALDPAASFLIEAPAGSGKTELLIQRYLRLLAVVERPESVVALTFTRKAAMEMKERVLSALREAAEKRPAEGYALKTRALANAVMQRGRDKNWDVLADPSRLHISTIDSFCALLTRQMPVVAGLGGNPQVLEYAEELYTLAAEQTLVLLAETPDYQRVFRNIAIHFDGDLKLLSKQIVQMLSKRDQWFRALEKRSAAELRLEINHALGTCIQNLLERVADLWPAELPGCPESRAEHLELWRYAANRFLRSGSKDPRSQYKDVLSPHPQFCKALLRCQNSWPLAVNDEQWQLIADFVVVLQVALHQLESVFRARGQVDFTRITQAAVEALGSPEHPSDLAYRLDYRIEHLLVDEFQDTSLVQYELLDRLTGQWSAGDGRTLFVVGDPMQSIYRFRDAEVGLFLRAGQRGVGNVRLEKLQLVSNFRSTPAIVDWINRVFAGVLPSKDDVNYGEVGLRPSTAVRAGNTPAPRIHAFVDDDTEEQQCRCVVELTRHALKQGRETAILVRTRAQLQNIFPALRRAGLPYEAVEIDTLAAEQHILDLLSLTRALHFSHDRISWLACLRAPWCGLTLTDLACLASGTIPLIQRIEDAVIVSQLSANAQARLVRFREVMRAAHENLGRVPVRDLVEAAWAALGGPAALQSPNHRRDAQTFFDLLESLDEGGFIRNFTVLNDRLQILFARPSLCNGGGVQVMTIHAAKGLEFDTVILPKLDKLARTSDNELLMWTERLDENGNERLLMAARPQSRVSDELFSLVKSEVDAKDQAEEKRLLYVAATRAKNQLHLIGNAATSKIHADVNKPRPGNFLYMLWDEVSPYFNQAMVRQVQAQAAQQVLPFAEVPRNSLYRLPAVWTLPFSDPAVIWQSRYRVEAASGYQVTYDWVSDVGRHVGTVVHDLLRRIAEDQVASWNEQRIRKQSDFARSELSRLGVPPEELNEAATRVITALLNTIASERGRWILSRQSHAACEWAMTGLIGERLEIARIDRTFIDETGRRWIVDYKTSTHEGGSRSLFLHEEKRRYQPQLESYARLLQETEDRPVSVGLYFPLLDEWLSWEVTSDRAETIRHTALNETR